MNAHALKGKTVLITGGSRGIGQAIGLRFADAGANIGILANDDSSSSRDNILALKVDLTDAAAIKTATNEVIKKFGGIDVLVNNLTGFYFENTLNTPPEKFDMLISLSVRAAFLVTQACLPQLKRGNNPHIINISPPLNMDPKWFKDHMAFSLSKYAMSLLTLGWSKEDDFNGIAVNSLWPQTTIATGTIADHFKDNVYASSRFPTIMADAAYEIVLRSSKDCTGNFFVDETLLREIGVEDFSLYALDSSLPLMQDLFVFPAEGYPVAHLTRDFYKTK